MNIFDGSGAEPFAGAVRVEGQRIVSVTRGTQPVDEGDARVIDGNGATLMPGMIEAHAHLSFASSTGRIIRERNLPAEEHLLITAHNAAVLLDSGFTSAYSAGSKGARFEVALKKEIDGGYLPGPRLVPSTFERAADADKSRSGPEALAQFIAHAAQDGVQSVKLLLSGDDAFGKGGSLDVLYTDEEVAAAGAAARGQGIWLAAHAQAPEAVKMAARHGFRVIYHCTHADEEALDLLEARRDDVFTAPAIGIVYAKAYLGEAFGFTREVAEKNGYFDALERNIEVYARMRKRGIRVLPGGDYGFPWNPIGENARDLELFVKLFSWSTKDVLVAATQWGADLIGMGSELGQIKEGFLADLLLVDGNPLDDVTILQDRAKLLAIMKDGAFRKVPAPARQASEAAA
ncbi:amidohydrolase family protein [Burkholderia multivorans]|uniref:amidohydrolase family protein n=1 Tax=Burkholderia multivorans TaxID=87883 RepID=UPI0031019DF2